MKTIDFITRHALCRSLTDQEKAIVQTSAKDLLAFYQSKPDDTKALLAVGESKADAKLDPARLAAWTMVCNQILNLDEVLNK